MMKYMFKNHLYAQAGTQLGLKYKASDEFLNSVAEDDDLYNPNSINIGLTEWVEMDGKLLVMA